MRSTAVALIGLTALCALSAAAPAYAQEPSPSPSPTAAATVTPSPTPSSEVEEPAKPPFWDVIGRVRYAINQWFSNLVTAALRPVFDLLGRTIFSTPSIADNARVVQLWRFSLGITDAALLLFVLAGAGIVMASGHFTSQVTAKELLPRLLLAAGAANVSLIFLGYMIEVSNTLSRAMLGAAFDPAEVSGRMVAVLGSAATANPFLALFALVVIVLAILVVIAYVVRVAALVLLASGAPLMLAGHALPQTEGAARMWWRATLAFLAAPVIQSMLLAVAVRVFLTGSGILGLPAGGGLVDMLVVGCLLYLLFKVPFWALNMALSGAGSRAMVRVRAQARAAGQAAAKVVAA